jgi:hypothetical protein
VERELTLASSFKAARRGSFVTTLAGASRGMDVAAVVQTEAAAV